MKLLSKTRKKILSKNRKKILSKNKRKNKKGGQYKRRILKNKFKGGSEEELVTSSEAENNGNQHYRSRSRSRSPVPRSQNRILADADIDLKHSKDWPKQIKKDFWMVEPIGRDYTEKIEYFKNQFMDDHILTYIENPKFVKEWKKWLEIFLLKIQNKTLQELIYSFHSDDDKIKSFLEEIQKQIYGDELNKIPPGIWITTYNQEKKWIPEEKIWIPDNDVIKINYNGWTREIESDYPEKYLYNITEYLSNLWKLTFGYFLNIDELLEKSLDTKSKILLEQLQFLLNQIYSNKQEALDILKPQLDD